MMTGPLAGYSVFSATSFAVTFGITGALMMLSLLPLALLVRTAPRDATSLASP
jgi:hypothetical protein